MEHELFAEFISKSGVAGMLMLAVWYVAKKLASAYESRIASLEKATEICEKDRIELRNMILSRLTTPDGGKTFNVSQTATTNK